MPPLEFGSARTVASSSKFLNRSKPSDFSPTKNKWADFEPAAWMRIVPSATRNDSESKLARPPVVSLPLNRLCHSSVRPGFWNAAVWKRNTQAKSIDNRMAPLPLFRSFGGLHFVQAHSIRQAREFLILGTCFGITSGN